jgi:RNA polymerase sigma factor (TIGR02999 family)
MESAVGELTVLLQAAAQGDEAAADKAYTLLYDDLVRLARSRLRRSAQITLAETGDLVNECWIRMERAHHGNPVSRAHFLAYAARAMRSVIVDMTRRRSAQQRGGNDQHVPLDTDIAESIADDHVAAGAPDAVQVHEALLQLEALDPRLARIVEWRYFAGLTEVQIAQALDLSERTVRRDWEKARAFLAVALGS